MTRERQKEIASFLMRVLCGTVLIYSGYLKISEPLEKFISSIMAYKIIPEHIAYYVAVIMPWIEVYIGVLLVFGVFNRYVIKLAILLFIMFEFLLLQAMVRRLEIVDCGCFGSMHSNPIGVEFMLNILWLILLFFSYKYSNNITIDRVIEDKYR